MHQRAHRSAPWRQCRKDALPLPAVTGHEASPLTTGPSRSRDVPRILCTSPRSLHVDMPPTAPPVLLLPFEAIEDGTAGKPCKRDFYQNLP